MKSAFFYMAMLLGLGLTPLTKAQNESSNDGCPFYFKTQNLCATPFWIQDEVGKVPGKVEIYFWNHSQGLAQQPVFLEPIADSIVFSVKKVGREAVMIGLISLKNRPETSIEGRVTLSAFSDSFFGSTEFVIQFKDADQKTTDSASLRIDPQFPRTF